MTHSSNELQSMIIFGFLFLIVCVVLALVGLSNLTGLPFWDVASNARTLLLGPAVLLGVYGIERLDVPLPFRLENTWPVIAGFFWIGVHRLLVMVAEQKGPAGIVGYDYDYDDAMPWGQLPWYAGSWCFWIVLILIVGGGYAIRKRLSSY
jgi:hypothetical protein